MVKVTRTYNLHPLLVDAFTDWCDRRGVRKETMVAAGMLHMLTCSAEERERIIEYLIQWTANQEAGPHGKKASPPPTAERQRRVG